MTAADLCQHTWPSDRPTRLDDTYRQHRCGFVLAGHLPDECWCRYCGDSAPREGAR